MAYQNITTEKRGRVGLIAFDRPKARNALNSAMVNELKRALEEFEADAEVGAIVLTGDDRAFAAGADVMEMRDKSFSEAYLEDYITQDWECVAACRKPVIAAVAGYALGGGCEIAMMCDFILAADNAQFGQPEITLGTVPGAGGSQRLTRLVGKSKAMEMCLTGRTMDAQEAERAGLVSRVVALSDLREEAVATATTIATMSRPIAYMIKEAINRAYETTLAEGIRFERRLFHAAFATCDQKEGMSAFLEKRRPKFTNT